MVFLCLPCVEVIVCGILQWWRGGPEPIYEDLEWVMLLLLREVIVFRVNIVLLVLKKVLIKHFVLLKPL